MNLSKNKSREASKLRLVYTQSNFNKNEQSCRGPVTELSGGHCFYQFEPPPSPTFLLRKGPTGSTGAVTAIILHLERVLKTAALYGFQGESKV